MIFLTENVPEVYVNESRDFQVLLRTCTASLNYLRFYINSLLDISDTKRCLDTSLRLLQTRLGFFTEAILPNEELRKVLVCFPQLIKYKGSLEGVHQAVLMYLNIKNLSANISEEYENGVLTIYSDAEFPDKTILNEVFRYLLPTGIEVRYMLTDLTMEHSQHINFIATIDQEKDINQTTSMLASNQSTYDFAVRNRNSIDTITIHGGNND